jgi:hypothetical protein
MVVRAEGGGRSIRHAGVRWPALSVRVPVNVQVSPGVEQQIVARVADDVVAARRHGDGGPRVSLTARSCSVMLPSLVSEAV